MKKRQRIILFTSACILVLMLLFPPFEYQDSGTIYNEGYSFILNPPKNDSVRINASVNSILLFIQSLIVIIAGGMFFLAFKPKKKEVKAEKKRHEFKFALLDKHADPQKFADEYIEKCLKESLPKPPRRGNC
jgi:amino acid transporter